MNKAIRLAVGTAAISLAAPVLAQVHVEAETCLIDETSPLVHSAFESNLDGAPPASEAASRASNQVLLACERKHGWTREQTINAAAYATFLLRFQRVEAEARENGMIRSRMDKLKRGASLLEAGDDYQFDIWLSRAGYPSFQHLTETRDFAYFEAWMQLLAARNRIAS